MDSIKLEKLITENMKSIFGFALTRLGNVTDAEYLASDILYEIIKSAQNLKDDERFYGFMWKIADKHGNDKVLFIPCEKNYQRRHEYGKIIRRKKLPPQYF